MLEAEGDRASEAATWMRNAHIAVCVFMAVCALSGLGCVFYAAFIGNALQAIAGALVAIGGVTLGIPALAAVRFGATLVARTERVEQLASRVQTLENRAAVHNIPVDPAAVAPDDLGRGSREEHQWQVAFQNGDIAACRRALERLREVLGPARVASMEEGLEAMTRAQAVQLREDFAAMVRSQNYEAALKTGERLAWLFPDSGMAQEFEALRPRLIDRLESRSHIGGGRSHGGDGSSDSGNGRSDSGDGWSDSGDGTAS